MSIPFGFSLPDDGDPHNPDQNPLAGLGDMLQSLGRMLSQSQGTTQVTAGGLIAAAEASGVDMNTTAIGGTDESTLDGLTAMCGPWVDSVTGLDATAAGLGAWTPVIWLRATAEDWALFVTPVAENLSATTANLAQQTGLPSEQLEQLASMMKPMQQMMASMAVAMMQQQVGSALGKLSSEILYAGELPMVAPTDAAAVLPEAVDAWARGLGMTSEQVMPWIVTREIASHRLIVAAPWLAPTIRNAVLAHSSGLVIDQAKISEAMSSIDPSNPAGLEELLTSGVLEPVQSPQQQMALTQLETLMALVEGWVDVVCDEASPSWVPTVQLNEAYRRRRATANPTTQVLSMMVGLEMSPTRIRQAADLWRTISTTYGAHKRDSLWAHPDLLPSSSDLHDPTAFIESLGSNGLHLDQ